MSTIDLDEPAERAVLAAALSNVDALIEAQQYLARDDWGVPRHALIWETMCHLAERGEPVTPVSVHSALMDAGRIGRVGGGAYIGSLLEWHMPGSVEHYAHRVVECARRRACATLLTRLGQLLESSDSSAWLSSAVRAIDAIDAPRGTAGPQRWADVLTSAHAALEDAEAAPRAIPSGLADLDRMMGGGVRPGEVVVVGGRPGSGKSVLLGNTAANAAFTHSIPTLMLSMEMSSIELHHRIASAATGVPLASITGGTLSDTEWVRLARHAGPSGDAPLWIDDTRNRSLESIAAIARRYQRRHGLKLLTIDYLQLIATNRSENRQVAVAELSRGLKVLAGELGIAVVLAAQLNRGPEERGGEPRAADLRESGAIEADADAVLLVQPHGERSVRQGEADLHLVKQRSGPTGTIAVAAQLHLARFMSMAIPEPEPDPASADALAGRRT